MTTMLDFYRQHQISPVKQDVSDLPAHFARRAFLYRSLGLPPFAFEDKAVLEVGAGSGENALYTDSLGLQSYTVLEPNQTGFTALRARLPRSVEVLNIPIEAYHNTHFDVVICEGLLGLCGGDPVDLLRKLTPKVMVGGVLVITCIDPISDHAEVLRRALAHKYITPSMSLQEKVDALKPVFAPHLATLKGMTRSVEDWILDNLLNPASIGPTFSIPEALSALDGQFELLGCSPRFLMDWRWYKDAAPGLQWAIDAYWTQAHNLYDYRTVEPARTREDNELLMLACVAVRKKVALLERGKDVHVETLGLERDRAWFGRGQQYLSLVRTT